MIKYIVTYFSRPINGFYINDSEKFCLILNGEKYREFNSLYLCRKIIEKHKKDIFPIHSSYTNDYRIIIIRT